MLYVRKYTNDWLKQKENLVESLAYLISNSADIKFYFGSNTEYSLKELLRRYKMECEIGTENGDKSNGRYPDDAMFQMAKPCEQVGTGETKCSSESEYILSPSNPSSSSATEDEKMQPADTFIQQEKRIDTPEQKWKSDWSVSTCTPDQAKQDTSSSSETFDDEKIEVAERFFIKQEKLIDTPEQQWIRLSMSTCTSDQVKQEKDLWSYDVRMDEGPIGDLVERKFRKMRRNLCKRCCPKDCFNAFKNVYKRMRKM